ncbi:hypothetical protein H5410_044683 [Solanum commersonii]|uniref:Reverse transcriptase domain-containing protein n=1 Tax=Solanum commersonii TaxID=4109 RepID=A0A9J5X7H4_SOLCO|nr:hypothetical protein H5410_044683 [Solanum commersonii]
MTLKWLVTNFRGDLEYFPVEIRLHQGSVLILFLFVLLVNELTQSIQKKIRWCMLFADDIVISKVKLSKTKIKYLESKFSVALDETDVEVRLVTKTILKREKFKYLTLASGILCDNKVPPKRKGESYKVMVKLSLLYGVECLPVKNTHIQKLHVVEMRMSK